MRFPQDERPGVFHLGAFDAEDQLVGIATVAPERRVAHQAASARLRGMAVEPGVRGRGVGTALLEAVIAECRRAGFEELWAEARDTALGFYESAGMAVVGEGFVNATGLRHHLVVLEL